MVEPISPFLEKLRRAGVPLSRFQKKAEAGRARAQAVNSASAGTRARRKNSERFMGYLLVG